MRCVWVWLPLLLLLLCPPAALSPPALSPGDLEEMKGVPAEVIVGSSPCSTTCGLGLRQQELCPLRGGEATVGGAGCRVRTARCLDTWQCGLQTVTGYIGGRLELDCLGEVMAAMGKYSFRVSWRYARNLITSDDSLFARHKAPRLDLLVLDPLREDNAGTYRCDVLDSSSSRLVKRVYKGVRVLPPQVLNLDYDRALAQWDQVDPGLYPNLTVVTGPLYTGRTVRNMVLVSFAVPAGLAGLTLLGLFWLVGRRVCRRRGADPARQTAP